MPSFDVIEFGIDDIVRSGIVKEYLIAKLENGYVMFEHVDLNLPPIKRETIDGVRYYSVPDEDELNV